MVSIASKETNILVALVTGLVSVDLNLELGTQGHLQEKGFAIWEVSEEGFVITLHYII